MPLKKGSSKKTVSNNIGEILHSFKQSGKIGNTEPGSMEKARKIAAAAAYSKARRKSKKHLKTKGKGKLSLALKRFKREQK
jgi:hypothetical protein